MKKLHLFKRTLLLLALIVGSVSYGWAAGTSGTINFGSGPGDLNVNSSSVSGDDNQSNTWTVTTAGTTSYTPRADYAQIGSSSKPATSITFTMTLAANQNITAFSAKFGGFSDTAGTVTLKVDNTTVGTGSLNETADVTVTNSSSTTGKTLTVTVTGISKGVKAYFISYTYEASGEPNTISPIADQTVDILKSNLTITPTSSNGTTPFTFSTTSDKISLSTTEGSSCVVTGLAVTGGTPAVIKINQAAGTHNETKYKAAEEISVNVSVVDNRGYATIAIGTPALMTVGSDQEISISSNSSGAYSFSSTDNDIAEADLVNDKIYILAGDKAGTATITVTQAETADYKETQKSFDVTVTDARTAVVASIDANSLGINTDHTFTFTTNSTGAVTITMDDSYEEYALFEADNVNKQFTLAAYKAGDVKVRVQQASNLDYKSYDNLFTITITDERVTPTFAYSEASLIVEQGESYSAPTLNSNATDGTITYTSSNPSVATINNSGVLNIVGPGESTITASLTGSPTKKDAETSYTLTVTKAAQALPYSESFESNSGLGDNFTTSGDPYPYWAYSAGDSSMKGNSGSKIDSESWLISPVVDLRDVDNASLTYSEKKNSYLLKKHIGLKVRRVGGEWEDVSITLPTSNSLFNNKTIALTKYAGSKIQFAFIYKSTTTDYGCWFIKSVNVQREKTVSTMTLSQNTATLHYNDTKEITVTTNSDATITASVEEGKENVCSVAKKDGETNVFIVTYGSEDGTADVTFAVAENETYLATSAKLEVTMSDIRDAAGIAYDETEYETHPNAAFVSPTLTNDNELTVEYSVVTVPETDKVSVNASTGAVTIGDYEGVATVTATFEGNNDYKPATASYTITIARQSAGLSYDPTSATLTLGDALSAPAFANPHSLDISYVSSNTDVATVTDAGVIALAGKAGETVITASSAQTDEYYAGEATFTITVNRKSAALTTNNIADMDATTECAATALYSTVSDGEVTFESSDATVAEVVAGVLKAYKPGSTTITISVAQTDTYASDSKTANVTVTSKSDYPAVGPAAGSGYTLVTSSSDALQAGDVLIFVNSAEDGSALAMSTTQNDKNRGTTSVTISEGAIASIGNAVQEVTLEGSKDSWYFNVGNGYLYAASSGSNYLRTESTKDDNAKAQITISANGSTVIKFQGSNSRCYMRFNGDIVSCYGSSNYTDFNPVYLYRKNVATTVDVAVGSTGFKTLVSNVDLDVPDGAEAYIVKATGTTAKLQAISQIKKHTPVILKATPSETCTLDIIDNAADYPATNLLQISTNTTGNGVYVLSNKGNGVGFYKWIGGSLGAGRVYLPAPDAEGREFIGFDFDDETTGIKAFGNGESTIDGYYDLSGRKVAQPAKGLYIVNGRKVVIK